MSQRILVSRVAFRSLDIVELTVWRLASRFGKVVAITMFPERDEVVVELSSAEAAQSAYLRLNSFIMFGRMISVSMIC